MGTQNLQQTIQKTTLINNIVTATVAVVVTVGSIYAIYYNTINQVSKNTDSIIELKQDVSELKIDVSSTAVFKGMSEIEQKNLKEKVLSIESKQDKIIETLNEIKINTSRR